jgi:hypothetical protein
MHFTRYGPAVASGVLEEPSKFLDLLQDPLVERPNVELVEYNDNEHLFLGKRCHDTDNEYCIAALESCSR